MQALFTMRIAQYVGHISFALYIVHGLVLYTLEMNMLYAAKPIWDGEGGWGKFLLAAVGAWIVDLIVSLYAADVICGEGVGEGVTFGKFESPNGWEALKLQGDICKKEGELGRVLYVGNLTEQYSVWLGLFFNDSNHLNTCQDIQDVQASRGAVMTPSSLMYITCSADI